jgi:hypothetical protein
MKREELKYFYATDGEVGTMPLLTNCFVYPKEDVDHLLDEKDAEIASLKSQIAEAKELSIELQKRNKAIADNAIINVESYKSKCDAEIESLKASHYAEMVDAGMRERSLRRSLWLARAERAKEKQQLFHFSLGYEKLCIDGFYDPYSGRRELSPKQWIKAFNKVEVKLLKKAEEYK